MGSTFNVAILKPDFWASNLNDPRWVPALEWFQKLIQEKVFNPAQITETTTFVPYAALAKQEIPSVWGGNLDIVGYAQGSAPQVLPYIHGALMPTNPASGVTKPRGIAATAQFAIFQNTKHLDSSTNWVAYLSAPSV